MQNHCFVIPHHYDFALVQVFVSKIFDIYVVLEDQVLELCRLSLPGHNTRGLWS